MSLIIAMCTFALVMSISPGPVNMVVISSGVNHGFRRTLPFISGATIGFTLLLLCVGLGFIEIIKAYPYFLKYLEIAGSLFIIYMGYKIATSVPDITLENKRTPTFFEGFLLQWLNPKAWIAAISGVSMFSNDKNNLLLILFTTIYFLVCYGSLILWGVLGTHAKTLLSKPSRMRIFNVSMGALLIFPTLYLMVLG